MKKSIKKKYNCKKTLKLKRGGVTNINSKSTESENVSQYVNKLALLKNIENETNNKLFNNIKNSNQSRGEYSGIDSLKKNMEMYDKAHQNIVEYRENRKKHLSLMDDRDSKVELIMSINNLNADLIKNNNLLDLSLFQDKISEFKTLIKTKYNDIRDSDLLDKIVMAKENNLIVNPNDKNTNEIWDTIYKICKNINGDLTISTLQTHMESLNKYQEYIDYIKKYQTPEEKRKERIEIEKTALTEMSSP